jgi:hypothetical protein
VRLEKNFSEPVDSTIGIRLRNGSKKSIERTSNAPSPRRREQHASHDTRGPHGLDDFDSATGIFPADSAGWDERDCIGAGGEPRRAGAPPRRRFRIMVSANHCE